MLSNEATLMEIPNWLPFHEAVNATQRELGVSRGKAEMMLRQPCSTGEIWSQKEPYSIVNDEWHGAGPPEGIDRQEWFDHDIDRMTDEYGCNYFVSVEKSDFQYWLEHQNEWRPDKQKKISGKQPRLLKLLAEIFKDERVPDPAFRRRDDLRADLLKIQASSRWTKLLSRRPSTPTTPISESVLIGPNRIVSD
jgi:hypothetical protein